jgi:hypothetical protein
MLGLGCVWNEESSTCIIESSSYGCLATVLPGQMLCRRGVWLGQCLNPTRWSHLRLEAWSLGGCLATSSLGGCFSIVVFVKARSTPQSAGWSRGCGRAGLPGGALVVLVCYISFRNLCLFYLFCFVVAAMWLRLCIQTSHLLNEKHARHVLRKILLRFATTPVSLDETDKRILFFCRLDLFVWQPTASLLGTP